MRQHHQPCVCVCVGVHTIDHDIHVGSLGRERKKEVALADDPESVALVRNNVFQAAVQFHKST